MRTGAFIAIVAASCLGFLVGHRCVREGPGEPLMVRVDTLLIRDTIKVSEPIFVTKVRTDTVTYPVTKERIVTKHDTLYVVMERDQIRWEDSLSVVYASGIDPHVDSVLHYTERMVITKETPVIQVKRSRWGIGVQAGYGADRDGLSPFVGVGISYNILSW